MTLRVWHLCSNRWNSAITEYALRSAQSLHKLGWQSRLSALPGSPCEARARELGVSAPSFRFVFKDILKLRREAQRMKIDRIVTYGGPETFLARFLGVPVVRFRGQDSDLSQPLSPFELKLNLGFCRAILTPAEIVAERFQKTLPRFKVAAVALGLDASVFYPRLRKDYDRPRILLVGRLDPIKGHEAFLELFSAIIRDWDAHRPKPFLEIIGQSANISSADLRSIAQGLKLAEGVDWGLIDARVPNLPERMANATLGVVPSLGSEVIGRVTEEFLLSGTPVLVAPVGSLKECLIDSTFGSILDKSSLTEWILRAFDESQAERVLRAEKARAHFSLEAMGQKLGAFLEVFV